MFVIIDAISALPNHINHLLAFIVIHLYSHIYTAIQKFGIR